MDNTSFNIDTALAIASESSVMVKYIKVIIWSMVPIAESRVAIPYGILPVAQGGLGLPLFSVAVVSVVANIVVTIPIIYLLDPISNFLRRYKIFDKFFVPISETRHPSEASLIAISCPRPPVAPVTRACFLVTMNMFFSTYLLLAFRFHRKLFDRHPP